MSGNYQPRGTSQTITTGGTLYQNPSAGDAALLQQQNTYELLSQQFVASIQVSQDAQNVVLAVRVPMTAASALAYQPTASTVFWDHGITDWKATYNAQTALASQNGWH